MLYTVESHIRHTSPVQLTYIISLWSSATEPNKLSCKRCHDTSYNNTDMLGNNQEIGNKTCFKIFPVEVQKAI